MGGGWVGVRRDGWNEHFPDVASIYPAIYIYCTIYILYNVALLHHVISEQRDILDPPPPPPCIPHPWGSKRGREREGQGTENR